MFAPPRVLPCAGIPRYAACRAAGAVNAGSGDLATIVCVKENQIPVVDVLVDDSGRLGPLSYLVPDDIQLAPGDAVTVPFGRTERHGLVLGPSTNPEKASRSILRRLGQRVDPRDMRLAFDLALKHFATHAQVAARLSPTSGRNSAPIECGDVALVRSAEEDELPVPEKNWSHRLYLRPPLVDPARLAALEATRLAESGQVLVLCPTVKILERVLDEFSSGAARLDSRARAGAWNGWRSGSVRIGIGTRAAALYSADRLAGIVVVEEEHPGHLESTLPYTHARDVARRRATSHECALSLISAAPTALGLVGNKVVTFPNGFRLWPKVQIVDRSDLHPSLRNIPPKVRQVVARSKHPVVTVAENRPSRRVCSRCGDLRACGDCNGYCSHRELVPCPRCGSLGVRWIGWDAARLKATIPESTPLTLTELANLPAEDRVVVFLNIDPLLTGHGLDTTHASASVLARAAEAAGNGTLLLVTTAPEHPVLLAARNRDLLPVVQSIWEGAKTVGLPPFGNLVHVRLGWKNPPRVDDWPGRVLGPRRRGNEWEVLVVASNADLDTLRIRLEGVRRRGKARISIS
jgi:primosomal protein N'